MLSFNAVYRANVQIHERGDDLTEMLSAKHVPTPSEADLAVVERLVNDGKLIAIPPGGTAKPRRVAVAAIRDGGEILLHLSRATTGVNKKK